MKIKNFQNLFSETLPIPYYRFKYGSLKRLITLNLNRDLGLVLWVKEHPLCRIKWDGIASYSKFAIAGE